MKRMTMTKRTMKRMGWAGRAAALGLLALASACTVQPLHGTGSSGYGGDARYFVEEVDTRVAQQVRNALIFGLNGGRNPAEAPYRVRLVVTATNQNIAIETGRQAPTAARVVVNTSYTVSRMDEGGSNVVAQGERSSSASYDRTVQRFANIRALRDAQNRAAKQVAERVRLAVQQALNAG